MTGVQTCALPIYGSDLNRVKDDKADAEMIAYYARRFYEPESCELFEPDSVELKALRSLYQFRNRVVCDRVAMGNRILSGAFDCSPLVKSRMKKHHEAARKDEKEVEREMVKIMESSPELASNYRILVSFKGIGPITAAALIIYTSNFKKFDNPRKFACYCGIAPFGKQSGTSINTKPHVSHFAHIGIKAGKHPDIFSRKIIWLTLRPMCLTTVSISSPATTVIAARLSTTTADISK